MQYYLYDLTMQYDLRYNVTIWSKILPIFKPWTESSVKMPNEKRIFARYFTSFYFHFLNKNFKQMQTNIINYVVALNKLN